MLTLPERKVRHLLKANTISHGKPSFNLLFSLVSVLRLFYTHSHKSPWKSWETSTMKTDNERAFRANRINVKILSNIKKTIMLWNIWKNNCSSTLGIKWYVNKYNNTFCSKIWHYYFVTDTTLLCVWRCEPAKNNTMYTVLRKHYFKVFKQCWN